MFFLGLRKIEVVVKEADGLQSRYLGAANSWEDKISLRADAAEATQEQTLCHEILELMIAISGTGHYLNTFAEKGQIKEQVCENLETIFHQFLKQNTNFFNHEKSDNLML